MASYWQISRVQYSLIFFSFQTKNWDTLFQTQKYINGTRELLMIQVGHWGHRRKGSTTLRRMGKYWGWCWFWIFLVLSSDTCDFLYTHKFLIGSTSNHMLQKLQLGATLSCPGVFQPAVPSENPPPCTLPGVIPVELSKVAWSSSTQQQEIWTCRDLAQAPQAWRQLWESLNRVSVSPFVLLY